jgi:polysaccharide pyruvyl transferase CsaB
LATHLLLAGYFGCGNLGDDAILLGMVDGLGDADVELTLLSGSPDETFRNYGIPSIGRKDFRAVEDAIKRCDVLVFPGGSVFQDVTSVRSPAYYSQLVRRAKKEGKKVVMLSQGVGPLRSFFGKRFAAQAFGAADEIVVRDPESAATLKSLGIKRRPKIGADLSFLLHPPKAAEGGDFKVGDMKTIGLAPRPLGRNSKAITRLFCDLARLLFQANMMPVLIEMDRVQDGPLIYAISKLQGGKVPDIRKLESPRQVQQRMARMECVIAMRLHAGILAATVDVPPFMVSYDPKVSAFAKALSMHTAPSIEGLTADRLYESFRTFIRDRERHLKVLHRKKHELTELAKVNIEALGQFVKVPTRA